MEDMDGLLKTAEKTTRTLQMFLTLVAVISLVVGGIGVMNIMTGGTVWFELALLLDVFVAVFVMGIAINHISDSFASIDVARFRSLRD